MLALALLLGVVAITYECYYISELRNRPAILNNLQQVINVKTATINTFLDQLTYEMTKAGNNKAAFTKISTAIKPPVSDFGVFIYYGDSLVYWSNNKVELKATDLSATGSEQLISIASTYYEYFGRKTGKYKIAGLLYLKRSDPKFENKYIQNDFNKDFNLGENVVFLTKKSTTQNFPVINSKGADLFYLFFEGEAYRPVPALLPTLFILSIMIFMCWLYTFVIYYSKVEITMSYLMVVGMMVGYVVLMVFKLPHGLFELTLFSPQLYASSKLLGSLGHLLLGTFTLTFTIMCIYTIVNRLRINPKKYIENKWMLLIPFTAFLTIIFYATFVNYLISGLVLNSLISFEINNLLDLSHYSFIGLFVVFMLMITLYLMCDVALRYVLKTKYQFTTLVLLFAVSQVVFLVLFFLFRSSSLFADFHPNNYVECIGIFILCGLTALRSQKNFTFYNSLWLVIGFAAFTSLTIHQLNIEKEHDQRVAFADKLENQQDLMAEFLFEDISEKIVTDKILLSYFKVNNPRIYFSNDAQTFISDRLQQNYFNGYWTGYNITIYAFNHNGVPISNPEDSSLTVSVFKDQIKREAEKTETNVLYALKNAAGGGAYIAMLAMKDIENSNDTIGTIVLTINSKVTKNELGYPEFLISQKQANKLDRQTYSYAFYKNDLMVSQGGNFPYMVSDLQYKEKVNDHSDVFNGSDGISYLFRVLGNGDMIVVSKELAGFNTFFTIFSYIFTFFFLSFVIVYFSYKFVIGSYHFSFDFKSRIQLTVSMLIIVMMLSVGGITTYNIILKYDKSQDEKLIEKTNSVLLVIENETHNRTFSYQQIDDNLQQKFAELSASLNCDFNIYDTLGILKYTTQPKVFELSLLGNTINREALNELKDKPKLNLVQQEQIGSLNYIAAYEPIRNAANKTVAYLNLPYFKNETDLRKELSSMLVTLINIYVPIFFITILLTLYFSRRLTNPLQLIQTSLSKVRLDKSNPLIEWSKNDEIGALVREYNRMVIELQSSAENLAQSERETAWREMARQVAHEIKNPLTPMKLSVQLLQRAMQDGRPDLDKMVKRFSENLVEQIDTLSNIATEFSNFAKMPNANNAVIDLRAIIKSSTDLYDIEDETKIIFNESNKMMWVYADKDQLLRVFSNLLKNAIQSIPNPVQGLVTVTVNDDDDTYTVAVSDNGTGIADDKRDRIFTPNFTTKTTGTGLGLAMAKQIVEHANGKLWFESKLNMGSTFYVSLPKYVAQ